MDMNDDVFMSDPFLSLDVDLDDVSEVIKGNAYGKAQGPFDASRTPSPQYIRDSDAFATHLQRSLNIEAEKEIGHIVSLLQDSSGEYDPNMTQNSTMEPMIYNNEAYDSAMLGVSQDNFVQLIPSTMLVTQVPLNASAAIASTSGAYEMERAAQYNNAYAIDTFSTHNMNMPIGVPEPLSHTDFSDNYLQVNRLLPVKQEPIPPSSPTPTNTKTELIRMLLEMSPTELENMRRSTKRHHSQAPIDPHVESDRKSSRGVISTLTIDTSPVDPAVPPPTTTYEHVLSPDAASSPTTSNAPGSEWRDDSDTEMDQRTPTRKGPKTERRTAHNLIEKKYRCSINDRITHLKEMLASDENKLSKSATLRKAIEHINMLRTQNADLLKENERLRSLLRKTGVELASVGIRPSGHYAATATTTTSRDSSVSPSTPTLSNTSSSSQRIKKPRQMLDQSRVTLCVFMFVMVMFNPVSVFFTPTSSGTPVEISISNIPHRTLPTMSESQPFYPSANGGLSWLDVPSTHNVLIWALNAIIIGIVLIRLLIYGEPVADIRSPTWNAFTVAKRNAAHAISVGNYKEARRQLFDTLQVLDRALPHAGGFDEFMSVVWQIIRHGLNGLWIGRWLARRRRSAALPVPAVCKSHAATSLVYHQLHQLYLIGVGGHDSAHLYGLNLALSAVNLAESAGIAAEGCDGITHQKRAEIYINAALRMRLSLPKVFRSVFAGYFLRRARRHMRKANSKDAIEWRPIQWFFHPLARNFLRNRDVLTEVLQNGRQMRNFPFCNAVHSPRPIDRLTNAFKIHLLALLVKQLSVSSDALRISDFVEISHLLLNICRSDNIAPSKSSVKDSCLNDWEFGVIDKGDAICTWWAHMVTCALYWRHGDTMKAHKHYTVVRKCPKELLNNDLALAVGLAFCTRKMCYDDNEKKKFSEMTWVHIQKSFAHIKKDETPQAKKSSTMSLIIHKLIRGVTYEWLLVSLLDVWHFQLTKDRPCWEQAAPSAVRRLYNDVYTQFKATNPEWNHEKLVAFKLLGRLLQGANPLVSYQLLKNLTLEPHSIADDAETEIQSFNAVQRFEKDVEKVCNIMPAH